MSGLGELDRPGAPESAGAWDARSEEWLVMGDGRGDAGAGADTGVCVDTGGGADTGAGDAVGDGAGVREFDLTGVAVGAAETVGPVVKTRPAEPSPPALRRRTGTAADPVKALMHRHRDLCERAVDPLEIAAGLEAHGVTDRTAARFRHRDVFSLAEEMYARVPRDAEASSPADAPDALRARADWALLGLLPGALCGMTLIALGLTHGQARPVAAVVGALAVALAVRAALVRGPLRTTHPTPPHTRAVTLWLVAYALLGDGLLQGAVTGGPDALPTGAPDGPWPTTVTSLLSLTLACVPAAWTAHLFAARARRKLAASRGLEDFADAVRPLLLGMFALFAGALTAVLAATAAALDTHAAYAHTVTLGTLLFLARLLTVHGFTRAPALVLTATAAVEATAVATVFAARLPGCGILGVPVEAVVGAWGPGGVPALACGGATAVLLFHATRRLTRASAHAPTQEQW